MYRLTSNVDVQKETAFVAESLRGAVSRWIGGAVWTAVQLFVTVFLLFFLFRDRSSGLKTLRSYLPLSRSECDRLLSRIGSMVHATLFGSVTAALVQGALGGLMFWILGVPAPLLWGMAMAFLGLVPMIGTFVVWAPAAGWLALEGHWVKTLILAGWRSLGYQGSFWARWR